MQQTESNPSLRCDDCAGAWDTIDQEHGVVLCNRCAGAREGWNEGREHAALESLEAAVAHALDHARRGKVRGYLEQVVLGLTDDEGNR